MKVVKHLLGALALGAVLASSSAFAEEKAAVQAVETSTTTQNVAPVVAQVGDKLNINVATASEIQKALTGIGAKKAEAIVQYREKHGNFTSAEQLLEVQGIGKATLDKNRDRLTF